MLLTLQRKGTAGRNTESLDRLATELQEITAAHPPLQPFDSLASQVLKAIDTCGSVKTPLTGTPQPGHAVLCAQGYLDQRSWTRKPKYQTDIAGNSLAHTKAPGEPR